MDITWYLEHSIALAGLAFATFGIAVFEGAPISRALAWAALAPAVKYGFFHINAWFWHRNRKK